MIREVDQGAERRRTLRGTARPPSQTQRLTRPGRSIASPVGRPAKRAAGSPRRSSGIWRYSKTTLHDEHPPSVASRIPALDSFPKAPKAGSSRPPIARSRRRPARAATISSFEAPRASTQGRFRQIRPGSRSRSEPGPVGPNTGSSLATLGKARPTSSAEVRPGSPPGPRSISAEGAESAQHVPARPAGKARRSSAEGGRPSITGAGSAGGRRVEGLPTRTAWA